MKQPKFHFGDRVIVRTKVYALTNTVLTGIPAGPETTCYVGTLVYKYHNSDMWSVELDDGIRINATQDEMLPISKTATEAQIRALLVLFK
jgi:hypothetical protein